MKARPKILPDEPRGSAWRSSARGVNCPVKSGKLMSDTMTKRLEINPDVSYLLAIHKCNKGKESSISVSTENDEILERFVRIAIYGLGIESNKILIEKQGEKTIATIYNSKLRKLLDSALERREKIFKYKNDYSANYFAGLFDCNGGVGRNSLYIKGIDKLDGILLERIGFHTTTNKENCYIKNSNQFIMFIEPYSIMLKSINRKPGNERDLH